MPDLSPCTDLLFDLDGTLIDSAPGILSSFAHCLAQAGLTPALPIDPGLIGPPLRLTLARLAPDADEALLDALVADFKAAYDSDGWRQTLAYTGLHEVLGARQRQHRLWVVTNKRLAPACRILDHLAALSYFEAVYALDAFDPPMPNKSTALAAVLQRHGIDRHSAVYVGDSLEDAAAAADNGLRFIAAAYGYGNAASQQQHPILLTLQSLGDLSSST